MFRKAILLKITPLDIVAAKKAASLEGQTFLSITVLIFITFGVAIMWCHLVTTVSDNAVLMG